MRLGWPMTKRHDERDGAEERLEVGGMEFSVEDLRRLQSRVQRRELNGDDWTLARALLKEHIAELKAEQARQRSRGG